MYSDASVDDRRLVELNALDAAEKGASILCHTRCHSAQRHGDHWLVTLQDTNTPSRSVIIRARALINAAGPWAANFCNATTPSAPPRRLRLVKGSHIIVRKLFDHPHAYIFQNPDGRIVFAIPWQQQYTMIGTTDVEYHGDPDKVAIDADEIAYLCALSNRYFNRAISAEDVVATFSGVRPLINDDAHQRDTASAATRDYQLSWDKAGAPLLHVFGGKITTYRKLAEQAVDTLAPLLGNHQAAWTAAACLPGGDMPGPDPAACHAGAFDLYLQQMQQQYTWLPPDLLYRYASRYGTRLSRLLAGRHSMDALGKANEDGRFEAEIIYTQHHEAVLHTTLANLA